MLWHLLSVVRADAAACASASVRDPPAELLTETEEVGGRLDYSNAPVLRQLEPGPRRVMNEMRERFIVAEVSKNWINGREVVSNGTLSQLFEGVVNKNADRGYRLLTFQLHRIMARPDEMNETIIAVFEKE
jgi:hypothetical protein